MLEIADSEKDKIPSTRKDTEIINKNNNIQIKEVKAAKKSLKMGKCQALIT